MKTIIALSIATLTLGAGLAGCDVKKTQEGSVTTPKFEKTREGDVTLPKYEVTPPKVEVTTRSFLTAARSVRDISTMLTVRAGIPRAVSVAAHVEATSSAFPVCDPHSTVTSSVPAAEEAGSPSGVREYSPARTPSNHARDSSRSCVPGGSTGTSPGATGAASRADRNPETY